MLVFISYHTPDHEKAQAVLAALAQRRPGNEWFLAPVVLAASGAGPPDQGN